MFVKIIKPHLNECTKFKANLAMIIYRLLSYPLTGFWQSAAIGGKFAVSIYVFKKPEQHVVAAFIGFTGFLAYFSRNPLAAPGIPTWPPRGRPLRITPHRLTCGIVPSRFATPVKGMSPANFVTMAWPRRTWKCMS